MGKGNNMNKELRLMRRERRKIETNRALLKYNDELSESYRQKITTAWQAKNFAVVAIYGKLLCASKANVRACQFGLYESKKRIAALNRAHDLKLKK